MTRRPNGSDGFAFFPVFLVLVLLSSLGGASLLSSALDLKASSHYKTAVKALAAADSGITHALSSMNTRGVLDFEEEVVDHWDASGPSGWFGSSWRTMSGDPGWKYKVWAAACSSSPSSPDHCPCTTGCSNLTRDYGVLYATGFGPNDANRTVRVKLRRGVVASPGALFLINGGPVASWNGASLIVNGYNHDMTGNLDSSEDPRPGVSTRDDATTDSIKAAIASNELDNFQGLGFDSTTTPHTPSVLTASGPDANQVAAIAQQVLDSTGSELVITAGNVTTNSLPASSPTSPVLVHLKNSAGVKLTGNLDGYGIIIAEGPVTFNGNVNWHGMIITKSTVSFSGSSSITGSMWATGVSTSGGGNATINYSIQALSLANGIGTSGVNVPRTMTVTAWEEADTPGGTVSFTTSY